MISVPLTWDLDPLEVLARWPRQRRALLLHSGRFDPRWARRSILAEPVGTYQCHDVGGRPKSLWSGDGANPAGDFIHKPFSDLRRLLCSGDGLWIGYLSFELGRWIENLPPRVDDDRQWPVIELGYCPGYLAYDHGQRQWRAFGNYARQEPELETDSALVQAPGASDLTSVMGQRDYESAVERVLAYINAGHVFQVNLAHRFTGRYEGHDHVEHRAQFRRLASVSPAWFGAYLELDDGRVMASTSPELFLEVDGLGNVVTRPIKGTRPAGAGAEELRQSEKDRAELNMIVDLMRNDLGRVCDYGSVRVPDARIIETHPTVHHGVATITGRLHHRRDVIDLVRATLPGGSVTGAPKIRALQIIDELEPVRRGPYCGSIGYLSSASTCLNIAIRTMLIDPRRHLVDFSVGGGIVADSEPTAEYQETLDKGRAMMAALRPPTDDADPAQTQIPAVATRL